MKVRAHIIAWILILLSLPRVPANHYQWWTCTAECRRCIRRTTPLEKWISEYYSGLFSREPPVAFYDSQPSATPRPGNPHPQGPPRNPAGDGLPGVGGVHPQQYGCCETEFGHWAPNDTEYNGRKYAVVHLKQEYQFIPVGRCRNGTSCQLGTCAQVLRAHWVLVFNNTKPLTSAPVSFVPIKIPSHCECLNIGRPTVLGRP